jgi:molybdopterin-containing oxidoreductase family molybdopterin binding subunit
MAQPQAFMEMMNNMDLVVVADVALCDTARYADIVLPAAGYFEQETVTIFYTPWISLNEKAIEPLYESKGDLEIANLLLTAMGHEGDVIPREQWIELAFNNDAAKSMNITYDRLKKEKYIYTHSLETDPKKAFRLGSTGTFHTDTGRAQFYFEALAPVTITGREWDFMLERLPYWKPPLEAWPKTIGDFPASPQGAKYPLVLINERDKFRVGTQFTYNPWLLELDPEPWTKINADDAAARGIKDGDYVKFYNDRGYYVSKAYISAAVMPGVVQVDRGYEKSQFKAGFHMDLESYKTDPVFVNQGHYDALIEMEKFTGSFERSGNFIESAI